MEKKAWQLFSTPVVHYKGALSSQQLETILNHCLQASSGPHGALSGKAASSFAPTARLIEELEHMHPILLGLKSGITNLVQDYAQGLGFKSVLITNSWFNFQGPGSLLRHHVHPESKVSAAICIHSDSLSSKLFLENPNQLLNLIQPDEPTEYTLEFAKFRLEPGDLLLFPSWIKHGSGFEPNMSERRVMISLNAS